MTNMKGAAEAALDINAELDAVVGDFALVKRGEEANWNIAQRTHRCTLQAGDVTAGRAAGRISMEDWCTQVRARTGRSFSTITGRWYKAIWEKYGRYSSSERPIWTDAYNDIRGVENMDANMVSTNIKRALEYATPEQKRGMVAQIVEDPEALADVAATSALAQPIFSAIAQQNSQVVDRALRKPEVNAAINRVQLGHHAERQADIDRVNASRERRDMENTLDHPGRTNRQFVTSAADMVDKLTLNVTTLQAILEQETVSYLRPEDVGILARKLTYLRDQAQRCIELLPSTVTATG